MAGLGKIIGMLAALSLVTGLGACASLVQTEFRTNRAAGYDRMPQRLFIVADLGPHFVDEGGLDIQHRLETAFAGCGVTVHVDRVGSLIINDAIGQDMADFHPDSVLSIQFSKDELVDRIPTLYRAYYHLEFKDLVTNSVFWKANMTFVTGSGQAPEFPKQIMSMLKADRFLVPTCVIS